MRYRRASVSILIALGLISEGGSARAQTEPRRDAAAPVQMTNEQLVAAFQAAKAAFDQARYDEAVEGFGVVVDQAILKLGPTHPQTFVARSWLALALSNASRADEAVALARIVEADALPVLGPDSDVMARIGVVLALDDLMHQRIDQGVARLEASHARYVQTEQIQLAAETAAALVTLYRMQNRYEEANSLLALNDSPPGVMGVMMELNRLKDSPDLDARLAAADRALAEPGVPDGLRQWGVTGRVEVLTERAKAGDVEAAREADRFIRAELASARARGDENIILGLETNLSDFLAATNDFKAGPTLDEMLAVTASAVDRCARVWGRLAPRCTELRLVQGVRMLGADRLDQARVVYEGLLADEAVSPGVLRAHLLPSVETGLATVHFNADERAEGYAMLRRSANHWTQFALRPDRRHDGRAILAGEDTVFRTQVRVAYFLAHDPGA